MLDGYKPKAAAVADQARRGTVQKNGCQDEVHMDHPTKHGICGDETAGPGGTFMAQCTIPATVEYCRMMEDLCPNAWAISYVNPTNFVADAVRRETRVRFIALCDCFAGFAMSFLPHVLDMPPFERRYTDNPDIKPRAIGINHCTWLVDLLVNGEDGYPLLEEKFKEKTGKSLSPVDDFRLRLLETYGYFNVCPSHCRMYWEHDEVLAERRALMEPRMRIILINIVSIFTIQGMS